MASGIAKASNGNTAAGHDEDVVLVSFNVRIIPGPSHNAADLLVAEIRAPLRALDVDDYGQCTECDEYGLVGTLCRTCEDERVDDEVPALVSDDDEVPALVSDDDGSCPGLIAPRFTVLNGNNRVITAALYAEAITNRDGRVD